ncbi:uncharacterized protein KD926_004562 [Aspergillus affinis]|uniref:uncharacterized protein n=1 Tax=Aspergillus affinis TaxID=1070780 RepID=UPI0022FE3662|nr:uncharacterized protein KD926_004562 [Aspergillus affinis]KAI9043059.1 hypothetical protein KD926_004562 [Aspergillus affinis]
MKLQGRQALQLGRDLRGKSVPNDIENGVPRISITWFANGVAVDIVCTVPSAYQIINRFLKCVVRQILRDFGRLKSPRHVFVQNLGSPVDGSAGVFVSNDALDDLTALACVEMDAFLEALETLASVVVTFVAGAVGGEIEAGLFGRGVSGGRGSLD